MWTILVLVLLTISLIVGAVMSLRRMSSSYNSKKAGKGVVAGSIALIAIMLFFTSLYTQDPGESVVLRSFTGEVIGTDSTEGIGFKAPWVKTISFDVRNQRIEMYTNEGGIGPDGAAISAGLTGGANVKFSIVVRYSIEPSKVDNIYEEYKSESNLLDRELRPGARDESRNAAAAYEPFTIKERRAQLSIDIENLLAERWEPIGIIVDGVDIGEIELDPDTEAAITAVNVSRQQVEEARNILEASRINAESTRVDAQADADADQIIRCGADTVQVTEVISGKEVTTTRVTPKDGDECEENLNEQVLTVKWLQVLEQLGKDGNLTIVVPNTADGLDLQPRIDLPLGGDSPGEAEGE